MRSAELIYEQNLHNDALEQCFHYTLTLTSLPFISHFAKCKYNTVQRIMIVPKHWYWVAFVEVIWNVFGSNFLDSHNFV